jgi:hypothetical protein
MMTDLDALLRTLTEASVEFIFHSARSCYATEDVTEAGRCR